MAAAPTPAAVQAFLDHSRIEARAWARQATKQHPTPQRDTPAEVLKNVQAASTHSIGTEEPLAVSATLLGLASGVARQARDLWFGVARVGQLFGASAEEALDRAVSDAKHAPLSKHQEALLKAGRTKELKVGARALAAQDWPALQTALSRLRTMRRALGAPVAPAEAELLRASETRRIGALCDSVERIVREKDIGNAFDAARGLAEISKSVDEARLTGYPLPKAILSRVARINELSPEIDRLRIAGEGPR